MAVLRPNPAEPTMPAQPTRTRAAQRLLKRLLRSKLATFGALILLSVVLVALFAPVLTSHDPSQIEVVNRMKPPSWQAGGDPKHLLGTDHLGRDVLARLLYGSQISLIVGFTAVAVAGTLGVTLGMLSGYFGGRFDSIITRIAEIQQAFPFILLAIAVMVVLGAGLRNIILVLGVSGWVPYARVVRAQTLSVREREFVEAAQAMGAHSRRIIFKHILPNVAAPVIVIASFSVASTIISEASLSFLGLGVKPTVPTWGAMLAEGREYLQEAWWLVTFPGIAIALTVLAINVLGDWLRDVLDPRMKNADVGR